MTNAAAGEPGTAPAPATSSGRAPAAQRRAREDRLARAGSSCSACGQRRRDPARRDRVDADAVGRIGDRQRLGQLRDAALAGAVAGHQPAAEEAQHRRGVDDAAARCGQQRGGGADAHRAGQVDVDDLGEGLRVVLGAAADDAGAVDQDVEPAEAATSRRRPPRRARRAAAATSRRAAAPRRGEPGDGDLVAAAARARAMPAPMPLVAPVTNAWRPDMSNMELIRFCCFVGWADCQSSSPGKTHLPQRAFVRKGLDPNRGAGAHVQGDQV